MNSFGRSEGAETWAAPTALSEEKIFREHLRLAVSCQYNSSDISASHLVYTIVTHG